MDTVLFLSVHNIGPVRITSVHWTYELLHIKDSVERRWYKARAVLAPLAVIIGNYSPHTHYKNTPY